MTSEINEVSIQLIRHRIQQSHRVMVVSHIRPDGDAIGSLLGLGLALTNAGKQTQMILPNELPTRFQQLPGAELIRQKPEGKVDLIIAVDCSDLQRIGPSLNGYQSPDINIDHHTTNVHFAQINLVDPSAVATSEILAEYLPQFDLPLDKSVASALLFGLISDTLGFRTPSVTAKSLRIAASLMDKGVDLPKLYYLALLKRTFIELKYWGIGLTNLKQEGRLVWTTLSREERQSVGYSGRDDADLINVLTTIDEADIIIVFVEQPNGNIKISWRSQSGIDVSKIASRFGGGGHVNAAGAEIQCSLSEAQSKVLPYTLNYLEKCEQTNPLSIIE